MKVLWLRLLIWLFCGKANSHYWSESANLLGIEVAKCERCGRTGFGPMSLTGGER